MAPALPSNEATMAEALPPNEPTPEATPAPTPAVDPEQDLLSGKGSIVTTESDALDAFDILKKQVVIQSWIMTALALLLTVVVPITRPIHIYHAINPEKKAILLVGLNTPNMTNRAILAWATTSITEVLTMGFGDLEVRLPMQKNKFTPKGWDDYVDYFKAAGIGRTFKQSQLVLTTVPSNTPVIINQGVNANDVYQWRVQLPIIMTYATNNSVMRRERRTVTLTLVRVPTDENPFGVAIQNWIIS